MYTFHRLASVVRRSYLHRHPNTMSGLPDQAKKALVLHAPGNEEMEMVTSVDVLRRGGVAVTLASITSDRMVKGRNDIIVQSDTTLSCIADTFDAIVVPGGLPAAKAMCNHPQVGELLRAHESANRIVAAICAGPTVLRAHQVAKGKRITSYPSVASEFTTDYIYEEADVVVDGTIITSRGPATAQKFALAILQQLMGSEKADTVAKALLVSQ